MKIFTITATLIGLLFLAMITSHVYMASVYAGMESDRHFQEVIREADRNIAAVDAMLEALQEK